MRAPDAPPHAPLHTLDATTLAALIRARTVTSRAVVEAHLARIDAHHLAINAIAHDLRETALAAADRADALIARPTAPLGPLHGVPYTLKENIDLTGSPTTHGTRALRDARPYLDAPVVTRLTAAGAICIGRTNQSEMGLRLHTDNPLRGPTRNPFDAALTPGGSSGGDAAAVATGMTPLGIGNDIGGSLRLPAHCCGVAALKPTIGRIAHAASLPPRDHGAAGQLMLTEGPIARTVADLRLALRVLAGRDPRDPRTVDAPLTGPPPDERRAALVAPDTLPPAAREALHHAATHLTAAGWTIDAIDPPELDHVAHIWGHIIATDYRTLLPALRPFISATLHTYLTRLLAPYDEAPPTNQRLHAERARLTRAWSALLTEHPILITPTLAAPIWPVDADLDPHTGVDLLRATTPYILPPSALGHPALTLPITLTDGQPQSIQIIADHWREDLCLDAAETIESALTHPIPTPVDPGHCRTI